MLFFMNYSYVRVHLAEMHVPTDEERARVIVAEMHDELTDGFAGHVDAAGHRILPLQDEDVVFGKKYMDVFGENGATYYLRRKFEPQKLPNWGFHNEDIMEAFYHKNGIKKGSTIAAVKCGDEWIADKSLRCNRKPWK